MIPLLTTFVAAVAALPAAQAAVITQPTRSIRCGSKIYQNEGLAGYGYIPSDAVDKFGDTIGGIGSAIFVDKASWTKTSSTSYNGILWVLPDRGWNTQGTLNYQNRVHKIWITLNLAPNATIANPSPPNFQLQYVDTVLFTDPKGTPVTGIDAQQAGPYLQFPGFNFSLPSATYTGDGFGGAGSGGQRVAVDSEGLVIDSAGYFWVSDEYGPFVYRFDSSGKMVSAIKPADAFIPQRNNVTSYSANSPPLYALNMTAKPGDPVSGRQNNQGFEGLTISDDGKTLYILLQSSTIQDGGSKNVNRRNTRFLKYDVSGSTPRYLAEYVVQLPYTNSSQIRTTAQSEVHYISDTQFLILSRDSSAGAGQPNSQSQYRHADVFDISKATNVANTAADQLGGQVASSAGVLNPGINPAQYCSFLDYNDDSQLNRFGVRNGGPQGPGLLNEKWESLALVPVDGAKGADGDFFLITLSDNDFVTQNGRLNNGQFSYADSSGYNLRNEALVWQVKLPCDNSTGTSTGFSLYTRR